MEKTLLPIGSLKVWWIPRVPGDPFEVHVEDLKQAKLLIDTLARYDQFQSDNRIKPDYSNAGGVMILDSDGEWIDWYDEETGMDFHEYFENLKENLSA